MSFSDPPPGPVAAVEARLRAARLPGRLAALLAPDLVVLGLGLGGWFGRAPAHGFAMHRRKSWTAIALVVLGLLVAETVAVHLLVASGSPVVAWIATALSGYAALWFAADLHALRLYPLQVTDRALVGSVGLRRTPTTIALTVDEPERLIARLGVPPRSDEI